MSEITNEAALRGAFREVDREELDLTAEVRFPLEVDDCFLWCVGPRVFLLFTPQPGIAPKGIVFNRNSAALPDAAAMCEWCHCVRGNGGVKLLTAHAARNRTVGLYLCADLSCVEKARELPGPDDLAEGLDPERKVKRILERISTFVMRRLF
jgi:hypothetical protein